MRKLIAVIIIGAIVYFLVAVIFDKGKKQSDVNNTPGQVMKGSEEVGAKAHYISIDKAISAKLLSQPESGEVITQILSGEKVRLIGSKKINEGRGVVVWYKVQYNGQTGWISGENTSGMMVPE